MTYTPELATVIRSAIEDRLFDLHTGIPGIVESYNPSTQRVTVIPALQRKYPNGEVVTLPNIPDVPVWFPAGATFSFSYPIAKGDPCFLMFSERSIEIWKRDGGVLNPRDPRKFHLSDCFAFVGGRPLNKLISGASASDMVLKLSGATMTVRPNGEVEFVSGSGTLKMTAAGKFKIAGAENLIALCRDFAQAVSTAKVLTSLGPQGIMPPESATISGLIAKFSSILES